MDLIDLGSVFQVFAPLYKKELKFGILGDRKRRFERFEDDE